MNLRKQKNQFSITTVIARPQAVAISSKFIAATIEEEIPTLRSE